MPSKKCLLGEGPQVIWQGGSRLVHLPVSRDGPLRPPLSHAPSPRAVGRACKGAGGTGRGGAGQGRACAAYMMVQAESGFRTWQVQAAPQYWRKVW